MPILDNARHERFAQELAKGKTAEEAYREAGYKPSRANAATLKANQSVQARVAELLSRVTEGVVLTKQWVIEQLIANIKRAREIDEGSVANRALELLGKEIGMFIDRKDIRIQRLIDMSPDEIDEYLSELAASDQRTASHRSAN